jgi:hypothetical protein
MSSRLCKSVEGAVTPFQIEPLEYRVDDAVDTCHVDETDRAPPHLHKNSFNDAGGPQLPPQMAREAEEGQQLG